VEGEEALSLGLAGVPRQVILVGEAVGEIGDVAFLLWRALPE
jgi:hypothetical protein